MHRCGFSINFNFNYHFAVACQYINQVILRLTLRIVITLNVNCYSQDLKSDIFLLLSRWLSDLKNILNVHTPVLHARGSKKTKNRPDTYFGKLSRPPPTLHILGSSRRMSARYELTGRRTCTG